MSRVRITPGAPLLQIYFHAVTRQLDALPVLNYYLYFRLECRHSNGKPTRLKACSSDYIFRNCGFCFGTRRAYCRDVPLGPLGTASHGPRRDERLLVWNFCRRLFGSNWMCLLVVEILAPRYCKSSAIHRNLSISS